MSGVHRRTLLRSLTTASATAAMAGCSSSRRAIRVVVVWSGDELAHFRTVVSGYERARRRAVEVVSAGDGIDAFLRARERAGNLPDVAVLPMPGLIAEYVGRRWLEPVPPHVSDRFPPAWNELLTVDGQLYGAWVKAAHKSLFWYLAGTLDRTPQTWDDLMELVAERANAGGPAPLAVGAADGWVLTDWLENLLAVLAPGREQYDGLLDPAWDWHTEPVPEALKRLGSLWRVTGAFPDGAGRALLTQFGESVLDLVARHRALMLFEADFVAGFAKPYPPGYDRLRVFRFPTVDGVRRLLVGGDAAVVFRDSPLGSDLVNWLTDGVGPFRRWIDEGGYLSPNVRIDVREYGSGLPQQLAAELQDPAEQPRFDLSDRLPGALGGADGVGMWRVLQDFFAAVTGGGDIDRAAGRAMDRLAATARLVRGTGRG